MKRRTKIVCTLGPSVDSENKIRGLIESGMNVARINCSHGDWEQRNRWVEWIRKNSPTVAPIAILADLQGPKFRLGEISGNTLEVRPGQKLVIGPDLRANVPVHQPEILRTLCKNVRVLLGDGDVELRINEDEEGGCFTCSAISGGTIKSRQGVTVVGKSFDCDVLTKQDIDDIRGACEAGVDYIALSYVHTGADMESLRAHIHKYNSYIRTCAKIETRAALKNIDEIVD